MSDATKSIMVRLDVPAAFDEQAAQQLAREAFVMQLYARGEIGSGLGASLLGITRWDFLDLAGTYNISTYDPEADLAKEVEDGRKSLDLP